MSERWTRPRESVVEERIREAVDRGEFDNLPGKGKPLPGLTGPDDELWWVKGFIQREGLSTDALLPTPLLLRKQVERLPETVRELPTEEAVRAAVSELNRQIVAYIRAPSGPAVPLRGVDVEQVLRQWRTDRPSARPASVPSAQVSSAPRPDGWWRRIAAFMTRRP